MSSTLKYKFFSESATSDGARPFTSCSIKTSAMWASEALAERVTIVSLLLSANALAAWEAANALYAFAIAAAKAASLAAISATRLFSSFGIWP